MHKLKKDVQKLEERITEKTKEAAENERRLGQETELVFFQKNTITVPILGPTGIPIPPRI